jgi:hypothetical protein
LRPDFQANTWPRLLKLKSNVSTRNRKEVVKGNPGTACKENFELMMSEHCKGRVAL